MWSQGEKHIHAISNFTTYKVPKQQSLPIATKLRFTCCYMSKPWSMCHQALLCVAWFLLKKTMLQYTTQKLIWQIAGRCQFTFGHNHKTIMHWYYIASLYLTMIVRRLTAPSAPTTRTAVAQTNRSAATAKSSSTRFGCSIASQIRPDLFIIFLHGSYRFLFAHTAWIKLNELACKLSCIHAIDIHPCENCFRSSPI